MTTSIWERTNGFLISHGCGKELSFRMVVHPIHGGYVWEVYIIRKEKLIGWKRGTTKTEHQSQEEALNYLYHSMGFILLLSSVRYLTCTYWEGGERIYHEDFRFPPRKNRTRGGA